MCLSVTCNAEQTPHPPTHPIRKFAGRSRSDLKKILILLGFLDFENFWLMGPPPPIRKFAGRSRSDLKKNLILLGFLDFENFQLMGSPPIRKFAGRSRSDLKKILKIFSQWNTPSLVSVYARFRAFGPRKQYKYHLYAGSQGGNISFGLLRVVGAAIIQVWGLPFCFVALQLYYGYQIIQI